MPGRPWLPIEESAVLDGARGQAEPAVGRRDPLPALLAPAAHSLSPSAAHRFAKALSALLWALTAIPAYFLARRLVPPGWSLGRRRARGVAPGAVYATAAVPDGLALLLAVSALPLVAAERRGLVVALVAGDRGGARAAVVRRPARRLCSWPTSCRGAGGRSCAGRARSYSPGSRRSPTSSSRGRPRRSGPRSPRPWPTRARPRRASRSSSSSVGVVPWLARRVARARTAETALLGACLPGAAPRRGRLRQGSGGAGVDERPLLVLVPLVLALAAAAWRERAVRSGWPRSRGGRRSARRASRCRGSGGRRSRTRPGWRSSHPDGARARARRRRRGRRRGRVAAARSPGAPLARGARGVRVSSLVGGHAAAWSSAGTRRAPSRPSPGRAAGSTRRAGRGAHVYAVGPAGALDRRTVAELTALEPDGSRRPCRSTRRPSIRRPGSSPARTRTSSSSAASTWSEPRSRARAAACCCDPFSRTRCRQTIDGLYADGWSGDQTTYRRFAGPPRPGRVRVTISRAAWRAPTVRARSRSRPPRRTGTVRARRRLVIHSSQEQQVEIPVLPPPFRILVTRRARPSRRPTSARRTRASSARSCTSPTSRARESEVPSRERDDDAHAVRRRMVPVHLRGSRDPHRARPRSRRAPGRAVARAAHDAARAHRHRPDPGPGDGGRPVLQGDARDLRVPARVRAVGARARAPAALPRPSGRARVRCAGPARRVLPRRRRDRRGKRLARGRRGGRRSRAIALRAARSAGGRSASPPIAAARDGIAFTHTEVDEPYEGRGFGSRLALAVLDDARRQHLDVLPLCPFIAHTIEEHPEYEELVAPGYRDR